MDSFNISYAVPEGSNIAGSRMSRQWRNITCTWQELVERCTRLRRTSETMGEFLAMKGSSDRKTKLKAAGIKDVGGFFGGTLDESGLRQKSHVASRTLITLDIDDTAGKSLTAQDIWDIFRERFPDTAAVAYTTHTHTPDAPRMRLVIPLAEAVAPELYPSLSAAVAGAIASDLMDSTAFSPEHFMYWPSTSADGEFLSFTTDGAPLDAGAIRHEQSAERGAQGLSAKRKVQSAKCKAHSAPELSDEHQALIEGPGVPVSVALARLKGDESRFCRTYTVEEAIDKYLSTVYTDPHSGKSKGETARYTYAPAGSADGLVCYNHFWARSFHSKDPACGKSLNAYHLVRLHMFGHLDIGSMTTRKDRLPSHRAMHKLCAELQGGPRKTAAEDCTHWIHKLETDSSGKIRPRTTNLDAIFANDPELRDNIRFDTFTGCLRCPNGMPWDKNRRSTRWDEFDDCHLRAYFDRYYDLECRPQRIADALLRHANLNPYHPIQEYLTKLPAWDGTPRVETLLCDYLGAADTPLNRQMTRKWMAAACRRVFEPGCKFDYCLVLKGEQGGGKSSVFEALGGEYHNGSLNQIEGKEGREGLQGSWIVEFSELSAMRRSEVETIKAFITDRTDHYREAYGRYCKEHPRQCVFCATTNSDTFLKDDTGNRRFWVVAVDPTRTGQRTHERIARLTANRDQIWAEAYRLYLQQEPLFLDAELEQDLKEVQQQFHDMDDDLEDRLNTYLETAIPINWRNMTMAERRLFYSNAGLASSYHNTQERTTFTVREFVCEMLLSNPDKLDLALCRRIKKIMRRNPDWEETATNTIPTGWAGKQRGFIKKKE